MTKLKLYSELQQMNEAELKKVLTFCRKLNKPFNQEEFDTFWSAYPRKVGKPSSMKAWKKLSPPLDEVLISIGENIKSEQWQTKTLIPHPTTWLNRMGWNDEVIKQKDFSELSTQEQKMLWTTMSSSDKIKLRKENMNLYCQLSI